MSSKPILSIGDFLNLPSGSQRYYTEKRCTFLAYRHGEDGMLICLYWAGNFFVEMQYDAFELNIEWIRPFKKSDSLNPYLERIDLTGISS